MAKLRTDYTKVCWYCGSQCLKLDERGVVCEDCGTTYNTIPKLAPKCVILRKTPITGGVSGSPLIRIKRRSQKAL